MEFAGLKRSGLGRLKDAGTATLSLESRFDLGYNSAHALCFAALRWHGYRSTNRYIVFQLLPHTLGLGPEVWRVLAKCHESLADSDILSRPEAIAQGNVDQSGPTTRLLLALWPQRSDNARVRGTPKVLAVIDPQAPSLPARSARR